MTNRKSQELSSSILSIPSGGSSSGTSSLNFRLGRDWFTSESLNFNPEDVTGVTETIISLTKGPTKFVGVGYDGALIYSDDGIKWTKSYMPVIDGNDPENWYRIAYLHDRYVAVPKTLSGTYHTFAYSYDGVEWTAVDSTITKSLTPSSLCYGNGIYAGADTRANKVFISDDGMNWRHAQTVNGISITFMNGYFYLVNGVNTIYKTADFVDIREVNVTPSTLELNHIASYENICVAIGFKCLVVSFDNGANWKYVDFTSFGTFEDWQPACFDGLWMIEVIPSDFKLGDPGTILYTTDFVHYGTGRFPNNYRGKLYSGLRGGYGNGVLIVPVYARAQPLISLAPIPTDSEDFPIMIP